MKKTVSISFIFVYLLLSVGVAKSTHYCMGKVMDESYFSFDGESCFGISEEMTKHCCSDELEVIKLENDQQRANFQLSGAQLYVVAPVLHPIEFTFLALEMGSEDEIILFSEDPPPLVKEPLYQVNCSFTFYG